MLLAHALTSDGAKLASVALTECFRCAGSQYNKQTESDADKAGYNFT